MGVQLLSCSKRTLPKGFGKKHRARTINLLPNTTYVYKFLNGPTNLGYELQGESDRIIHTLDSDTTLDIICFDIFM